jgi:hypothetical protein
MANELQPYNPNMSYSGGNNNRGAYQTMMQYQRPQQRQDFTTFGTAGNTGTYTGNYTGTGLDGKALTSPDVAQFSSIDSAANPMPQGTPETAGMFGIGGEFDFGQGMATANSIMSAAGTAYNIYNMYQGNKRADEMLGFAREEAGRAADKWGITLEELGRIKRVRQNLSAGYSNNGNYAAQNAKNPTERKSQYVEA